MLDKLLSYENPIISFLTQLGKLILLNFLWIIFCLPVITIGAATTALFSVSFLIINQSDSFPFTTFFKKFKTEFIASTKLWFVILLAGAVFGVDMYFGLSSDTLVNKFFVVFAFIGLFATLTVFTLGFPQIALYKNNLKGYIKNSLLTMLCNPFKLLLIWIIWAVPVIATIYSFTFAKYFGFIWAMCGFSGLFCVSSFIIRSIFKKVDKSQSKNHFLLKN